MDLIVMTREVKMVGDLVKSFLNEIGFERERERERERENLLLPSDLFSELGGLLSDSLHSRANGFEALHKPEFRSPTNNQPRSFLGPKQRERGREREREREAFKCVFGGVSSNFWSLRADTVEIEKNGICFEQRFITQREREGEGGKKRFIRIL
jgi:hypothetical protein